jgi:hypothetical protein
MNRNRLKRRRMPLGEKIIGGIIAVMLVFCVLYSIEVIVR